MRTPSLLTITTTVEEMKNLNIGCEEGLLTIVILNRQSYTKFKITIFKIKSITMSSWLKGKPQFSSTCQISYHIIQLHSNKWSYAYIFYEFFCTKEIGCEYWWEYNNIHYINIQQNPSQKGIKGATSWKYRHLSLTTEGVTPLLNKL